MCDLGANLNVPRMEHLSGHIDLVALHSSTTIHVIPIMIILFLSTPILFVKHVGGVAIMCDVFLVKVFINFEFLELPFSLLIYQFLA